MKISGLLEIVIQAVLWITNKEATKTSTAE
jgi:hypothetical protein